MGERESNWFGQTALAKPRVKLSTQNLVSPQVHSENHILLRQVSYCLYSKQMRSNFGVGSMMLTKLCFFECPRAKFAFFVFFLKLATGTRGKGWRPSPPTNQQGFWRWGGEWVKIWVALVN